MAAVFCASFSLCRSSEKPPCNTLVQYGCRYVCVCVRSFHTIILLHSCTQTHHYVLRVLQCLGPWVGESWQATIYDLSPLNIDLHCTLETFHASCRHLIVGMVSPLLPLLHLSSVPLTAICRNFMHWILYPGSFHAHRDECQAAPFSLSPHFKSSHNPRVCSTFKLNFTWLFLRHCRQLQLSNYFI